MPRPHGHPPRIFLNLPGTVQPRQPIRLLARVVVNLPEVERRKVARPVLQEMNVHCTQDLVAEFRAAFRDGHVRELGELGREGSSDDDLSRAEAVAQAVPEGIAREVEHRRGYHVQDAKVDA